MLYARMPASLLGALSAGILLVWGLWPWVALRPALAWVAALLVVSVARWVSWNLARRWGIGLGSAPAWGRWHTIVNACSGVVWGSAAWALWVPGGPSQQMILALVLGGMAAGAAATHASRPGAFLAFGVPALLPMAGRMLAAGDRLRLVIGILLLALLAFLYAVARVGGRVIAQAVTLRVENEDLLATLEARAEERLARFQALLDQAGVGILVVDPFTLRILDANGRAAELLGRPLDGLPGQALAEVGLLARPPGPGAFRALLEKVRSEGAHTLEDRVQRDGEPIWLETIVDLRPFGERTYVLLVLRDVSERRALQSQLSRSSLLASVGTLAGGTAHEVNNPLSYVMGNIEYVLMRMDRAAGTWPEEARIREALDQAMEGAEQIRRVVRSLGEFSRLEAGSVGPVDLNAVLERCISLAQNEIRHRARLAVELPELPPVLGEPAQLSQVFLNLLVNAAQAIAPGAVASNRIGVRAWAQEGFVSVAVSDTGVGMDEAVSARVFEPFFTTRPVGQGMGLGLAVAHGIVSSLGGRIEVAGRPGAGTVATVQLPAAPAAAEAVPVRLARPAPPSLGRVLVIDDDPAVAEALVRALGESVDAEVVTSGEAALTLLETGSWDLVLCDLMMPDLSGMELYDRIAARRPKLGERFVFVTGGAFTDEARSFLERVAPPVLQKPFDRAALESLVSERLPQRARRGPMGENRPSGP